MKVTIEKGTTYYELSDEQELMVDTINRMIWELEDDLLPSLKEVIDYDDPRRQHTDHEGYRSTIEGDMVALGKMLKEVKDLYARLSTAVHW
jgi:predicted transcriptional regulator